MWVTEADITAIAERRGMDRDAFRSEFVRNVGDRLSLTERPDGDCSMLDEKSRRCTVYEVRPIQCRTWPFWRSNVESPQTWQETCEVCPGAGQGDLVPLVQIETQVAARDV